MTHLFCGKCARRFRGTLDTTLCPTEDCGGELCRLVTGAIEHLPLKVPKPPFFVWVEGTNGATKQHSDFASARVEADRLGRLNPSRRVHILASTGYSQAEPTPVVWHPAV